MTNLADRRRYSDQALPTTLATGIGSADSSCTVVAAAGFPTQYPWLAVVDGGTASQEIVKVTNAAGTTLTLVRGVNSTALAHGTGATFIHEVVAQDVDEANEHISKATTVHGVTGSVVGTTDVQTLSSKTLVQPVIDDFSQGPHDHGSPSKGGLIPQTSVTGLSSALAGITGQLAGITPGAWVSYTPTWSSLGALGTGPTVAGAYMTVGKTVFVKVTLIGGTGAVLWNSNIPANQPIQFTLPVAARGPTAAQPSYFIEVSGHGFMTDANSPYWKALVCLISGGKGSLLMQQPAEGALKHPGQVYPSKVSGAAVVADPTNTLVQWGAGGAITAFCVYEAA